MWGRCAQGRAVRGRGSRLRLQGQGGVEARARVGERSDVEGSAKAKKDRVELLEAIIRIYGECFEKNYIFFIFLWVPLEMDALRQSRGCS